MKKIHLVRTVAEHMVDNDLFEEDVLNDLVTDTPKLSQAPLELEKAKIEAEKAVKIEKKPKSKPK